MDLTPKQQTSEAIRQAETILVTTGQHPSIDQAAAVVALGLVLRKLGKKVTAVISDSLPPALSFIPVDSVDKNLSGTREFIIQLDLTRGAEADTVKWTVENGKLNLHVMPFKGGWTSSDVTFAHGVPRFDLALALGVPTRARLDRIFADNPGLLDSVPLVNLDFHRSNENYGAVNLIEPTASSLSEILMALSESLQTGLIDPTIATVLLTGIMASTDRFTASHTTPKSLTVAAQLMSAGANQPQVVRALYHRDNRGGGGRSERPRSSSQQSSRPVEAPKQVNPTPSPTATTSTTDPFKEAAPDQSASLNAATLEQTAPIAAQPQLNESAGGHLYS